MGLVGRKPRRVQDVATLFQQIAPGLSRRLVAGFHPRCGLLMSPWFSMKQSANSTAMPQLKSGAE
jgi:hypothetical protein